MHKGGHAPLTHPLLPCMLLFPSSPQSRSRGGATRCLRCHDLKPACCADVSPALWAGGERGMPTEGGEPVGAYLRLPIKCVWERVRGPHTPERGRPREAWKQPFRAPPILGHDYRGCPKQQARRKKNSHWVGSLSCKTHPTSLRIRHLPFLRGGQDLTYYLRFGRGWVAGARKNSPLGFSRLASDGAVAT